MRKIMLQVVGLALIGWGLHTAGSEPFAPYLLRDGLLLGLAGAVLFAVGAGGWQPMAPFRRRRTPARHGELLLLTGLLAALGGGLGVGIGLTGIPGMTAWAAWGLGLLLAVAGILWPGGPVEYAQPGVRWARDAVGRFVAEPAAAARRRTDISPRRWRSETVWLIALLALAALLRFWDLANLPPACIGAECTQALHLVDPTIGASSSQPVFDALASLWVRLGLAPLTSLRLSAALIGWLTVAAAWAAVRRIAPGAGGLLATLLLAISPWHIWASRTSDPWLVPALLTTLVLWLGVEATLANSARMWVWAGLAFGLLYMAVEPLQFGIFVWLIATVALGVGAAWLQHGRDDWRWPLVGLVTALAAAAPVAVGQLMHGREPAPFSFGAISQLPQIATVLVLGEGAAASPIAGAGLIQGAAAVLAMAGLAVLARHLRWPTAAFVVIGFAALLLEAATVPTDLPSASLLLPLLPLLTALAAAALDRLTIALITAWGPPVLRPSRIVGVVAVVLLLLAGRSTVALMAELRAVQVTGDRQVETAVGRWIADRMAAQPNDNTVYIVPPAVAAHPSVRLLAGKALAEGRIQPLEWARTLPYGGETVAPVVYLVPTGAADLQNLVQQVYPQAEVGVVGDPGQGKVLLQSIAVSADQVAKSRGADLALYAGSEADAPAAGTSVSDRLEYQWGTTPPHAAPWRAEWSASLVVPEGGTYRFRVDSAGPESTFSLELDDRLILDSGLGVREQQAPLASGLHRLNMVYRSGNQPGDLTVQWGKVGEPLAAVAGAALHRPQAPDSGLLGDYYANDGFALPVLEQRQDPLITPDLSLKGPYSVRWQGKLAAPRAGEYLIGAATNGSVEISVDQQLIVQSKPDQGNAQADAQPSGYSEGLIYLPVGWHDVEVRYVRPEQPNPPQLQLVWQPAGSGPGALDPAYLLPRLDEVSTLDAPLPPLPLVDSRLGNDAFALSRVTDAWHPDHRLPPSGLPPLQLESLWRAGNGCGAGQDQFNAPHGVAFSVDGSQLFVADTQNKRIKIYALDGGLDGIVQSDQLQEPVDLVATANGVYVLDAQGQQLFRIQGQTLQPLAQDAGFYHPRGLGADAQGNLLVADTGGGRVAVVGAEGKLAGAFGGQGTLLGKGQPVDAVAVGDTVWAVTAEDGRLWNLTNEGSLTAVQPTGTMEGPHMAAMPDGRLLITDPAQGTFTLFSAQGQPLGQFGYAGALQQPVGIAAAQVGSGTVIAVADTRQCSLSVWRLGE